MKDTSFTSSPNINDVLKRVEDSMINLFHEKLSNIILYGSYARNENTSESDIDIMVLANESDENLRAYEDSITDIMVDLSLECGIVLSLYSQSVQDFESQVKVLPFLMNIQKEGIRLYG